jgi:REP element-mobilizing transposase RayT
VSIPRQLLPGSTYLVTRRCAQRALLLVPNEQTNAIVAYCLAEAAARTGVEVACFVAMSNHIHAVVTDPNARLPEFMHRLDRNIAVCMNAALGRTENFWAATEPSVVELGDGDDILDKMAYVIANPTSAGLVSDPEQWPGVITPRLGYRALAKRPQIYFRPKGGMPDEVELRCAVPPPLRRLAFAEVDRMLASRVKATTDSARAFWADRGRRFLGREAVLAARTAQAAATPEPLLARSPRFAARDPERRRGIMDRLRAFHQSYQAALSRWRTGIRAVVFPSGTYWMRVFHGAATDTWASAMASFEAHA